GTPRGRRGGDRVDRGGVPAATATRRASGVGRLSGPLSPIRRRPYAAVQPGDGPLLVFDTSPAGQIRDTGSGGFRDLQNGLSGARYGTGPNRRGQGSAGNAGRPGGARSFRPRSPER